MNVSLEGNKLSIKNYLGEKIPRVLEIKEGASVKVENENIVVESISKEIAGQVSADIEQISKRVGFDSRVFQDGIYIIEKDGKVLK
jgi:large subunit ribosomal protein L6